MIQTDDYRLYVELCENDESRGRIAMDKTTGKIELMIYECAHAVRIPGEWLLGILARAKDDLTE